MRDDENLRLMLASDPGATLHGYTRKKLYIEYGDVFFISCPIRNAVPGPDKSGHRPPWCIIVKSVLHMCPDLWGTLRLPFKGHEIKKTSPYSSIFSFLGDMYLK